MNFQNDQRSYQAEASEVYGGRMVGAVEHAPPAVRAAFLNKMYLTLTAGVAITMATAFALSRSAIADPDHFLWSITQRGGFLMIFLVYLALSFGAHAVSRKPGLNLIAYGVFTAFTGLVIAPMFLVALAQTQSFNVVWQALGLTGLVFGALTGYVVVSGKDFSFMRGFLFVGFWVLLGFMIVSMFFASSTFHIGVTCAGLLLFAGFVLYDTSVVMHHMGPDEWVGGALRLFVDFINMFIRILSLLLNRR